LQKIEMVAKGRQSGLSLTEMAVVVAVMALLAGLALPAVRMIMESFESGDSAASMISAALASARALAAKEGHYVGVRFQMAYNFGSADPCNPLNASQYMVFIVHDPEDPRRAPDGTDLANGFRAVEGCKPIKLPDSIGVMDLMTVQRTVRIDTLGRVFFVSFTENPIDTDVEIDSLDELRDTTAFSVVFSPSSKLLIHEVRVRNRLGVPDTPAHKDDLLSDDVFNIKPRVDAGWAMFYQDDESRRAMGLGPEYSRKRFLIYNRAELKKAFTAGVAWSAYLVRLVPETIYINPHTGTIIPKD
jgi:prepilin-type N-terminal cleavage/methylation domain-containing protein